MMKYFSMFSGIGGFDIALNKYGHECVGYSEIDKYAIQIYEKHFGGVKNFGDATKINPKKLPDFDLLCGGFPCQSFSIAGKRLGFEDTRGTLFFEIARIIKGRRPRLVFLENVKGLLNHDNGRTFATILATFDELGYNVEWQVLNSKYFGVPQNRERVFIIGHSRKSSGRQIFPIEKNDEQVTEKINTKRFEQTAQCLRARDYENWGGNFVDVPKVAGTLTGGGHSGGHSGGLHSDMTYICIGSTQKNAGKMINKSTCLGEAMGKGGGHVPLIIPVLTPNRPEKRQNGRRFKEAGDDMFTLTGQDVHGILVEKIQGKVEIRKYPVDIIGLKELLKDHKNYWSTKEISEKLDVKKTTVDHWFRTDDSFSIPDKDIWFKLKKLLNIRCDEFDKSITEFEIRDNEFDQSNRVYQKEGISPTLTGISPSINDAKASIKHEIMYVHKDKCQSNRIYDERGIAPTIPSRGEKTGQNSPIIKRIQWDTSGKGYNSQQDRAYFDDGIMCCLPNANPDNKLNVIQNQQIRRLTPIECELLQSFPRDWTKTGIDNNGKEVEISDSQRYKMLGNAVTVNVIEAIAAGIR